MKKIILITLMLLPLTSEAALLNWYNDVDYTAGSLNQTFNNIDGSGVNVNFTWSGNTNRMLAGLPDDDKAKTDFGMSALFFAANFSSTSESVSLVITFTEPVYGVHFHLYDIDGVTPLIEKTRIKGFLNSTATLPSSYGAGNDVNIQLVPIGSVAEDGIIFSNKGSYSTAPPNSLNEGWLTFDGPINKIGMQFKASAGADMGQLIGDIGFVPEPATISMLGLGVLGLLKKRKA